jgi:hypothetical protein
MSRRNQSRRRRTYGRRQHEVRERRPDTRLDSEGLTSDSDFDSTWSASDGADDRGSYDTYASFGQ